MNYIGEGMSFQYIPGSYILYTETSPVESDITTLVPQMVLMNEDLEEITHTDILFNSDGTITYNPQIEGLSQYKHWSISDDKLTLTFKQ